MSRVAILSDCVLAGDALGNDVLGMRDVLSAQGHEVAIFTGERAPGVAAADVAGADRFLERSAACLIYHFAIGWEPGLELLRRVNCRRVVRYHNVTPPRFFEGLSEDYVALCRRGREQVGLIARAGCDLYLPDSSFNARELAEEGLDGPTVVVPPFHQVDRLEALAPDPDTLVRFGKPGLTNVLSVGRLVPNKRHGLLIDAFARYHREYNRNSRLLIVGKEDPRLAAYSDGLREQVRALRLQHAVAFTGGVSDASLKACYLVADVLLTTSEHEGFCVPLVEAMAMGVPIVAVASSAVPETLGGAGLSWSERDPALLAGSIHLLASEADTRAALVGQGLRRFREQFSNQATGRRLLEALGPLLS